MIHHAEIAQTVTVVVSHCNLLTLIKGLSCLLLLHRAVICAPDHVNVYPLLVQGAAAQPDGDDQGHAAALHPVHQAE